MTLLIVIGSLLAALGFSFAYATVGRRRGKAAAARQFEYQIERTYGTRAERAERVRKDTWASVNIRWCYRRHLFFWPFIIFGYWIVDLVHARNEALVDRVDPTVKERELAAREKHIADLERELGIDKT